MAFHLGVLRYLAQHCALEQVDRISSVSGGSLLVGLILQQNDMRWPSSERFVSFSLPTMRARLCESSLQWAAARRLLNPLNWRFLLSRANLLSLALQQEWGVRSRLADIPPHPIWSINGTNAETGKRFRFKSDSIGDYVIGTAKADNFPLATALAVSAAFPGGFGPLTLKTGEMEWKRRSNWGASAESAGPVDPIYPRIHLYDGGVYDNLGLEPFFDAGEGAPKVQDKFILVSDASAPLPAGFSYLALNPWRLKRVADIMSDQARALRVRTFVSYLKRQAAAGAYVTIGAKTKDGIDPADANHPARFPTTLRRLALAEFDKLADHGYQVTRAVHHEFGMSALHQPFKSRGAGE